MPTLPCDKSFQREERDQLRLKIYRQQGDTGKQDEILARNFEEQPCLDGLNEWLAVIGEDQRARIIEKAVQRILEKEDFNASDTQFLLDIDQHDAVERHIKERIETIDGDHYHYLLEFAVALEAKRHYLVTCLLYRRMLLALLEGSRKGRYTHGARYLKRLDILEAAVSDWETYTDHQQFKEELRQAHGRKTSFWGKYDGG